MRTKVMLFFLIIILIFPLRLFAAEGTVILKKGPVIPGDLFFYTIHGYFEMTKIISALDGEQVELSDITYFEVIDGDSLGIHFKKSAKRDIHPTGYLWLPLLKDFAGIAVHANGDTGYIPWSDISRVDVTGP